MADRLRSYEIGEPVEHQTLSFLRRAETKPLEAPKEFVESVRPVRAVEKRAIWIVHGMGQQVPFETLDALAQGVLEAASSKPNGWEVSLPPRVVSTKFSSPDSPSETQVVQRVEFDLQRSGAVPDQMELHLYEAYWAPLTEGVAKVSDVLSFLYDGALHGLLNCTRPFRRAMFPDDTSPVTSPPAAEGKYGEGLWNFRIRGVVPIEIIAALLIVFALGAINAVILAASAAKLNFPMFGSWPISEKWDQLTAIATVVTALGLTFGAVLFLAEMSRPTNPDSVAGRAIGSLALHFQSLVQTTKQKKSTGDSVPAEPVLPSPWPAAQRVISYLSWISLSITAASIVAAAILLTAITRWSSVAAWFHRHMHYRATQFVFTTGILAAVVLCAYAARRNASNRSQRIDSRSDPVPFFLFVGSFLLHLGLLFLSIIVPFHRFFDPRHWNIVARYAIEFFGSPYWVWPSLLAISKLMRDLLVEYPGDVAIYVAPNKLDRFDETRKKIKQLALDSLMPLYSACGTSAIGEADPSVPLYSQIGVVGHSLGSVIAYDTLNKLLTLDQLLNDQFGVADRTCIFETFGSPLDKTAFFFSFQGTENFNIREQLAACVQPLIQSYARFRKFPWINVYSPSDIICGQLKFYDVTPPDSSLPPAAYPVWNVRDPNAVVPLIAHVEYWKNPTVWNKLFEKITG